MKKRVLFVMEKWCDGTPQLSFTNSFHNFVHTLVLAKPEYHINTIHSDECLSVYNKPIDEVLLNYCKSYRTDVIIFSFLGGMSCNPSLECCKELKNLGVQLAFLWHDSNPIDIVYREQFYEIADLYIVYDNATSVFHDGRTPMPKEINLFAPQDSSLYYPDEQDIPISFIGSMRDANRARFFSIARVMEPRLFIAGGQREQDLTPERYADYIRRSKICVNYSFHPFGYWQIKGRVFESLASQNMLLESANNATRKLLKEGVEYVEYSDMEDFLAKAKYYLHNDGERIKIATAGHQAYLDKFHGNVFWNSIFDRLDV